MANRHTSKLGQALRDARDFVAQAIVRLEGAETQGEHSRWLWVHSLLSNAIGELDDTHVRLPPTEQAPSPTPEQLDPDAFNKLLHDIESTLERAAELEDQRMDALSAGAEDETPYSEPLSDACKQALRLLWLAQAIAHRNAQR